MKWHTKPLAEVADFCLGKMLDEKKNRGEPRPYLANINVRWGEFDLENLREMRFEDDEMDRYSLRYGDIVMCEGGEPGRCAIWKEPVPGMMIQKALHRIRPHDYLDAHFLFYSLLNKGKMGSFSQLFTGSTIKHFPREKLAKVQIEFPQLEAQRRIGDVLSAYDDLIENNRRRMALLEESARLLYQEWFVRLRFPGHEHTPIANGLPEGWVRKSLGEVADFRLGKMLDQNKNKGELMPYLANVNVRWGAIDLNNLREMRFEDNELDTVGLRYGDIVMCEGGEPGRCALWKEQIPRMMIQKAIHRIRAHPEVSCLFLYYCLRHKGQSGQLASLFTGATIKHLPREKLAMVQVDIPPVPLVMLFAEQVDLLEKQSALLEASNRRASQARDLLLPRLMSGEIAV
jgi:type I restriction enzyme S subunit